MRTPVVVLVVLLSLDGALIAAHLFSARLGAGAFDPAWLVSHPLRLDAERGLAESLQYLKYLVMAALALGLRLRGKLEAGLVLALFCLLLLVDDAFQLHERVGGLLVRKGSLLSPASQLSAGVGELLGFTALGLVFAWFLASSWRAGGQERSIATGIALLVAALALFGGLVDLASGPLVSSAVAALGELAAGAVLEPTAAIVLAAADPGSAVATLPQIGAATLELVRVAGDPLLASAVSDVRQTNVLTTLVEEGGELATTSLLLAFLLRAFLLRPTAPTP